uniref:BHLH domain-containing protein n=1 Tax=Steinernema glaseri TaxID=37863 RepID=A0A1I8A6H4_9BILA
MAASSARSTSCNEDQSSHYSLEDFKYVLLRVLRSNQAFREQSYSLMSDLIPPISSEDSYIGSKEASLRQLSQDKQRICTLISVVEKYLHKADGIMKTETSMARVPEASGDTCSSFTWSGISVPSTSSSFHREVPEESDFETTGEQSCASISGQQWTESCCSMCSGGCYAGTWNGTSCYKASLADSPVSDRWALPGIDTGLHCEARGMKAGCSSLPRDTV